MFAFLSQIFNRRLSPTCASRGSLQIMLLAVILGLFILSFMVSSIGDIGSQAAYRIVWLVLATLAAVILCCSNCPPRKTSMRRVLLVVVAVVLQLLLMRGVFSFCASLKIDDCSGAQLLLVMPYALAPTMASVLVGRRLGVLVAVCASVFGLAMLPPDFGIEPMTSYIVLSLLAGGASAALTSRVHKREQILYAGFASGALVFIAAFALSCQGGEQAINSLRDGFDPRWFVPELLMALGMNFLVAVILNGSMPMLERVFNISTPITWLEWADMNHPVLRKLSMTAPGTYHHSLMVQRLAEAGAEAIGADVTRAGVCALYHDIGKIRNPQYFSENISNQANSPHNELTPEGSARVITSHVADGVEIAQKYRLNHRIVSAIREHHGVSTAYFFYRKALDQYNEAKQRFDEGLTDTCPGEVDKAVFTYKGPIPQTRESGIVSLADAVESATRSLQHPTEEDLRNMIDGIVKGRVLDGHLQDSDLTLGEIALLKEAFFATIRTMGHNRIAYPKPTQDASESLLEKRRQEEKKSVAVAIPLATPAPAATGDKAEEEPAVGK